MCGPLSNPIVVLTQDECCSSWRLLGTKCTVRVRSFLVGYSCWELFGQRTWRAGVKFIVRRVLAPADWLFFTHDEVAYS